jgi:hypothetical protein
VWSRHKLDGNACSAQPHDQQVTWGAMSRRGVPVFAVYVMSLEIARFDLEHSLIQRCRAFYTDSDVPKAWRVPLSAFAEVEDGAEHDHYVC